MLALLISAVLSSQFVAPNDISGIDSIAPNEISEFQLMTRLPELVITYATSEPSEPAAGYDFEMKLGLGTAEPLTVPTDITDGTGKTWKTTAGLEMGALHTEPLEGDGVLTFSATLTEGGTAKSGTVAVKEAVAITLGPEGSGAINTTSITSLPAVLITCTDVRGFEDQMMANYTKGNKNVSTTVTKTTVQNADVWTIDAIEDASELGLTFADFPVTLTVKLSVTVGTENAVTRVYHPEDGTLVVTLDPAFKATPDNIAAAAVNTSNTFTLTNPGSTAWAATDKYLFTKTAVQPAAASITGVITAGAAPNGTITVDLVALNIPYTQTALYLWVKKDTAIYNNPFIVAYDGYVTPTGNFSISVTSVAFEDLAAVTNIIFTNTSATESTPWETTMKAMFTHGNNNVTAAVNRTGANTTEDPYVYKIATVNFTDLNIDPATGANVTVTISPQGGPKYVSGTNVTITVAKKVTYPVFKFLPENITEAQAKGKVAISAEPNVTATAWDDKTAVKVIFTLNSSKPEADVVNQTWPIAKPDGNAAGDPYLFEGEADLSKMTIPNTTESIYVWIRHTKDTTSVTEEVPVVIPYITTPPVEKAKFIITPNSVKADQLAKDASPGFTVTIVANETAPEKAAEAKLVWAVGTKSTEVKFAPGGNATNTTWVVAEKLVNFTALEIATFPTVGTVTFFPDTTAGEPAFGPAVNFTFAKKDEPEAAMGVSPLLSLLAAALLLLIKLF